MDPTPTLSEAGVSPEPRSRGEAEMPVDGTAVTPKAPALTVNAAFK